MMLILQTNFTEKLSVVKLKFGFSALLHLSNNLLVNLRPVYIEVGDPREVR